MYRSVAFNRIHRNDDDDDDDDDNINPIALVITLPVPYESLT